MWFRKTSSLVTTRTCSYRRAECRLFAGHPAPPRRRPAGTVDHRARKADKIADDGLCFGIDDQSRRAAAGHFVVVICVANPGSLFRQTAIANLMIANDAKLVFYLECPHSVMSRRRRTAVGHHALYATEHVVFEAFGQ